MSRFKNYVPTNVLVELVDDTTPPTDKNYVELDFLADLIVDYEKEHYTIGKFLYSEELESPLVNIDAE